MMKEADIIGRGAWLKFFWRGHIVNWFWRDRKHRRNVREKAWTDYKLGYLKKYIPFIHDIKIKRENDECSPVDEKFYSLWFQGVESAPPIVKACIDSIKRIYGDRFLVLTDKTIYNYVQLPDYIINKWESGKIGAANFSDIVRIDLLSRQGGYWFDATDYLMTPVPRVIEESDFFMFVTGPYFYPQMFVQTCFMRAKKGDTLIRMWRELVFEYWKREERSIDYFIVHLLFRMLVTYNAEAKALFEKMPKMVMDPTHRLWHEIGNLPFDEALYEEMKKDAFFQKCSYKPNRGGVNEILPGSMADFIINGRAGNNSKS